MRTYQTSIIPLAPVWHMSLNHCWVECPICKSYNTAQGSIMVGMGKDRHSIPVELPNCPECGQAFDWSDEAIEKACKYSKDYPRQEHNI